MSIFTAIVVAAMAITPSDRMAMADRRFNQGDYETALKEYTALRRGGMKTDELLYRTAECYRALGQRASSRTVYQAMIRSFPASPHIPHARLMSALAVEGKARREELLLLDSDSTPANIRAAALYYLAIEDGDAVKFQRSLELDPNGKYAPHARMRRASILAVSGSDKEKEVAVQLLTDIAFGADSRLAEFAEDAYYLAAATSYSSKSYKSAGNMIHRYLQNYPDGKYKADLVKVGAWCDYLQGKYADALVLCGRQECDDTAYLMGACHYALGEKELALADFRSYLKKYPSGRYINEAELPLARLECLEAEKSGDMQTFVAAALRAAKLGSLPSDSLRLAWAYEKAGRTDDALKEYVGVADRFPGTREASEAMYLKAMIDLRARRWSAADLALKEALGNKLDERRIPEAKYWRGIASVQLEHAEEGVALLKEALASGLSLDMTREARLIIADFDYNAGRIEEAKAAYRELVANGAADRMSAKKTLTVGKLIDSKECARALTDSEAPEWRQAGWALLGRIEESGKNYQAAIEAYRKAVEELVETEELPPVMLRLGVLETGNGEFDRAEKTLVKAVDLNKEDALARAEAYLNLAKVALGKNDRESAEGYATVVATLFDKTPFAEEARKMLENLK